MALPKHLPSHPRGSFSRLLARLRLLTNPRGSPPPRGIRDERRGTVSRVADTLDSSLLPLGLDLSSMINPGTPPEYLVIAVWDLLPSLPIGCELFGENDLDVIGSRCINAGGFADVWMGKMNNGTTVAIKSYRYYSSSSCLSIYIRLYNEALACSLLSNSSKSFVPFVGIYSTKEHPFALVFKLMDRQNLGEYLRGNQDIRRPELLLEIARGLNYMHNLGIVHGNVKITNILVGGDRRACITGLGTTSILPTMPTSNIDRSFHGAAPELIDPQRWGLTDAGTTTATDVYAFGVLSWEVFAGRVPFPGEIAIARAHSMSNGRRPARPDHPELSDSMWEMIEGCWKGDPARRKTMSEVVAMLEVEVNAPGSGWCTHKVSSIFTLYL